MAMSGEAEIVTVDKIAINILTVLIYCVFGQTQCRGNDTNRVRTQRLLANNTAVAYEQHNGCMRTTLVQNSLRIHTVCSSHLLFDQCKVYQLNLLRATVQ